MKLEETKTPKILRYFTLSLFFSIPFILFFTLQTTPTPSRTRTVTDSSIPVSYPNIKGIRIRPGYPTYASYLQRQLNKTQNPKLRQIWTTRDWDRKINVFVNFFNDLRDVGLINNASSALCIGARVGQEVEALRRVGVTDSIGIDLVPYPPLVIKGDFHNQPFEDERFDFEFSNVFDHALYPEMFVKEIERTLKPGGVCVLHVAVSRRSDKYSANDLDGVDPVVRLFSGSDLVRVRKVDGFGLDTEVVFRKKGGRIGS
ncbi:uncharacterized protein LOC141602321 [Silene latifolia]|uniref:uncharacterized protein LOC141602321 n=1 Tax=Silene latifolia TaxID=37657 RepID=UPI003D787A1A